MSHVQNQASPPPESSFLRRVWSNFLQQLPGVAGKQIGVWLLALMGFLAIWIWGWIVGGGLTRFVGTLPSGAVVAFDLSGGCPLGWEPYDKGNGRFLIGAATPQRQAATPGNLARDASRADLVARPFDSFGGAQAYLLSKENVPPLFLKFHTAQSGPGVTLSMVDALTFDKPNAPPFLQTSDTPAQPYNAMPPYIALHFCRKN